MAALSGEFRVTIDAPPDRVWSWVADLGTHDRWSPKRYKVEWIEGEPNAVGSRFRSEGWVPGDKKHMNEGRITERVENQRFGLTADDKEGTFVNTYTLAPSGDGTEVTFHLQFPEMKGMLGLVVRPLFALTGKPDNRKRVQLLKQQVESVSA